MLDREKISCAQLVETFEIPWLVYSLNETIEFTCFIELDLFVCLTSPIADFIRVQEVLR